jgi:hypothetical protein
MTRIASVLMAFPMLACASAGPNATPVPEPSNAAVVSSVEIEIDSQRVNPEAAARMDEFGGLSLVRDLAERSLRSRALLGPAGAMTLRMSITGFRFRSEGVSIWLGVFAGSDTVAASAQLLDCSDVARAYKSSASSIQGGLIQPSSTSRFRHLIVGMTDDLAGKIASDRPELLAGDVECPTKAPTSGDAAIPHDQGSAEQRLRQLERLRDENLISEEEYLHKRDEILHDL